ncbi:hypothetical protein E3N88_28613 [Mikania micrantha]|uniref:Reverse transcriptase Ty1/copia-type domain-containing protein n=1 Tax=Mikania micrantha TaxID=192012 RepID=A0A5N6N2X1_9ASTR|nr:hypothetical protein E3N88_28613 [Mikania micrantha]
MADKDNSTQNQSVIVAAKGTGASGPEWEFFSIHQKQQSVGNQNGETKQAHPTQQEIPLQTPVANESGSGCIPIEAGPGTVQSDTQSPFSSSSQTEGNWDVNSAHSASPSVAKLLGSSSDPGSSQYGVKRGPIQPQNDPISPVIREEEGFDDTPIKGFKVLGEVYKEAPHRAVNYDENELLLATDEPFGYSQAAGNPNWEDAMRKEIESIVKNQTWILTNLPKNAKPIGLKWVYKIKKDASGKIVKYKARLVAKGYVQQQGVDYDEVFAPVARMETVRILFALAAHFGWMLHHLDVKSAFLHGDLKEEVYVVQPEGFVKKGSENKVYKLVKALYGLKQAPRAWNAKLDSTLKDLGFTKCSQEQAVYKRSDSKSCLLVGVYVDDLIVTGSCEESIAMFKRQMEGKFEMSDLGPLAYYLGIEVQQGQEGITITQTAYVRRILEEAGLSDCNSTKVPMDPGLKLSKTEGGKPVNATNYRRLIGCLRYLLHTRPDLSFAVSLASRYMKEPNESHLLAIKQVMRYIKGTLGYGIKYKRSKDPKLYGYSDSSFGVNQDDGKSTTGWVFYFGDSPISWSTQKQGTVALSSCEAEFMAATAAACQAIWLSRLLNELTGWKEETVVLKVDNKSALLLMKNPVFHGRSKHINIRYHFIRECIEKDLIKVEHVSGEEQKADILTKALPRLKFAEMRSMLGVEEMEDPIQKLRG